MRKPILFMIAGLAGGFVIAAVWPGLGDAPPPLDVQDPVDVSGRLAVLERRVEAERLERERVQAQLESMRAQLDLLAETRVPARDTATPEREDAASSDTDAETEFAPPPGARERMRFARRRTGEGLIEALAEAGFSLDRASWIERRTQELRVEAMQAQYEAEREGEPYDSGFNLNSALRSELGDLEYERYLEATGRPTSVSIGQVLASSSAEQAGMLPGDEIYSYAGERVFSSQDLNRLQLEGAAGEPVVVELLRDGQVVQLTLPRGPIGITSARFRGRAMGGIR